jgi:hypothetical protein
MPKDNYSGEFIRYTRLADGRYERASTGERLGAADSRAVEHLRDWRKRRNDGLDHDYSHMDCGIVKEEFDVRCVVCTREILKHEEHVQAFEYNNDQDVLRGFGRICAHEIICEACWEKETGKKLGRQRFRREGPGYRQLRKQG